MINIGIYLATDPFGGGTYQYNLSIIKALDSLDKQKYQITAFCHAEDWKKLVPADFKTIISGRPIFLRVLGRLYKMLDTSAEGYRRFAWLFNPIIRDINKSNCDVVIYPSQDTVSYQTNKKSLSTIHDLMHRYEPHFEEYQNGEYEKREKHYSMMCKYTDGILVDSTIGKQHVIESYDVNEKKVSVLPFVPPTYLLESKDVDVKNKYYLPDDYLFYPAQFWEHKNHINLLEALKILKDRNIQVNLVLVGSKKNNYLKVMQTIDDLGLKNQVYILGYVSNDEMASLYKNATATAFVSLIGPTNIPPMEALTLGSPLICSDAYGMPEQVEDGALLVNPKSPEDIADKIEKLISNKVLQEKLIENGKRITLNYGQNEFNAHLESIILTLSSLTKK